MTEVAGDTGLSELFAGNADLEQRVGDGLDAVERALVDATASDADFVTEAARHLLLAGGKRFRPLLALLAAEFGDPGAAGVVPAAVVVELTHQASLYHDDVMDSADVRRGASSANRRWGNDVAILTGDWLFARASQVVADLGPECVQIQARTFSRLVVGQIAETRGPRAGQAPLEHYLAVLAEKTGALIATSALLGAKLAGADERTQQVLAAFGERIGLAFQLADDMLDVTSEFSGKTPGTDLREGVATLPVLMVRAAARPEDARLLELMDGDLSDDAALADALALLRAHPAMGDAEAMVRRTAAEARTVLADLPDIPARAALERLADSVSVRDA